MGLDMYLTGEKFFPKNYNEPEKDQKRDGFRMSREILDLGYWRKHPDLHGFIVENFAEDDDCQPIGLSRENITDIMKAIRDKKLPDTEGFFFGESDGTESKEDLKTFQAALDWLDAEDADTEKVWRSVVYQASW